MGLAGIDEHHALHSYNLIRGEKPYGEFPLPDRRKLFNRSVDFACECAKTGITADVLTLDRRQYLSEGMGNDNAIRKGARQEMEQRIADWLTSAIDEHRSELVKYDVVKVYYDNGQDWLAHIIRKVLSKEVVEEDLQFKKDVDPKNYKLLQVADLLCTNALLQEKLIADEDFTRNDVAFFRSSNRARKRNMRKASATQHDDAPMTRSAVGNKVHLLNKRLSRLLQASIPKP